MSTASKISWVLFAVAAWCIAEAVISNETMNALDQDAEDAIAAGSIPGMRDAEQRANDLIIHGNADDDQFDLLTDIMGGLQAAILNVQGPPQQCRDYRAAGGRRNIVLDRNDPQMKASMKFGTIAEDVCISKDPAGRDGVSFQSYCMSCMLNSCLSDEATCRCRHAIGGDRENFLRYVAGRLYNDCGGPFSTNYCEQTRLANIVYNVRTCL